MRILAWDSKGPNEVDDFSIDWTNQLKGETLASAVWSLSTPAGVTIVASSVTSPFAKVRLSGGVLGQTAILLCQATTSGGRQLSQSVKVSIVNP